MGNAGIKAQGDTQHTHLNVKTYSISEILSSGGTTAFATKMGKKPQNLAERLKDFPKEDFLTEEEANKALDMLKK
jgi:hypothetical protein